MTDKEYFDELEKNRVEMVPKGDIADSITKVGGDIYDFCLKDRGFIEEYKKSGNKNKYEDVLEKFIDYLFKNKNNPRIKQYYIKTPDGKALSMMDMEDAFQLYKKFVNNDIEALKELDEANEKGEKVADMVKTYEEKKKMYELNKQKLVENAVDVDRADFIKYCKVYLSNDFAEKAQIRKGAIFSVNEGAVYDENNQAIYVKGEFQLVYVDEEKNIAITKAFFDKLMEQYSNKRKNNNIE